MKRLLVTGARGFIGRHILSPAVDAGFEVHALASSPGAPDELTMPGVRWHSGDLLAPDTAEYLVSKIAPSHILHAAWTTAHDVYWESPENLRWLAAGTRLVEAFAAHGGRRFVFVGTCAEYDWQYAHMREGKTPEIPGTFYGAMKLAHHAMVQASARRFGFSAATGRIFFSYGQYENPQRIVPYICRQLLAGLEAKVSSGKVGRDFMHVTDVARGFVALLQSDIEGACNVSSGVSSLLVDIATMLGGICGRGELIRLGAIPDRPGDPPTLLGDNALLCRTGWKPRLSIEEGLRQTFEWWRRRTASGHCR